MAAWAGKGVGYVDTTLGIGCCWRSRQGATDEVGLVGEGLGMPVVVYATPGGAAVGAVCFRGKGLGKVDATLGIGCHWRSRQGAPEEVGSWAL